MKQLILVRHAKSDKSMLSLADIDRPLNERGYSDSHIIAKQLKEEIQLPVLFISSPAIRAWSTAMIFASELNYDIENILVDRELYETSVSDYLKVVAKQNNDVNTILIFGHNPTISEVHAKLNSASLFEDMPTSAISIFQLETDKWSEVSNCKKDFKRMMIPADFKKF
jgi:phosphohistidine phosphatase